jgi:putative flippase GtrA
MIRNYVDLLLFKEASGVVQFLRYGAMSAAALVLDVGVLMGLTWLGMHYLLSATLAFLVGATVVYLGSVAWVFPKRSILDRKREVTTFLLIGVAGLILTDILLYFLVEELEATLLIAKVGATVLVFLFNFTARKFLLFT